MKILDLPLDVIHDVAHWHAFNTIESYRNLSIEIDKIEKNNKSIDDFLLEVTKETILEDDVKWYGGLMKIYRASYNLHRLPFRIADNAKWFYQRGRRGYSDRDVWGLNHYLAYIISSSLTHLRDNTLTGYPANREWDDLTRDQASEQWQRELTMLAEAFKLYNEQTYTNEDNSISQETWNTFAKFFNSLWD